VEYLTVAEVLVLHARLTQRTGGYGGLRDVGLLEAALAAPRATFDEVELHPDLWHKAAALMRSLISNHPFVDGNKRVALAATGLFLELNGYRLETSNEDVLSFTRKVVGGGLEIDGMAEWLTAHCRPIGLSQDRS
jgi:death-on-curing protein